jgi:choice-of-anchor A domain-containing protein
MNAMTSDNAGIKGKDRSPAGSGKQWVWAVAAAVSLLVLLCVSPSWAVVDPFGTAGDYNGFILGDVNHPGGDSEGAVAVGGNATFSNYGVGFHLPAGYGAAGGFGLVVGGNLNWTNGEVFHGQVHVGGTYSPSGVTIAEGPLFNPSTPIDFGAEGAYLQNLSSFWAGLTTTGSKSRVLWGPAGTWSTNGGALVLTGNSSTLNVFSVFGWEWQGTRQVNLNVPAGSSVIINVAGTTDTAHLPWGAMFINLSGAGDSTAASDWQNVIWNFHELLTMDLSAIGFKGSLFAPLADITYSNGNVEGHLIANSLTNAGSAELHLYPFQGDVPVPTSEPEPLPDITIAKTVYAGHDGGVSHPGGELVVGQSGDAITYVFTVTNTGNTHLDGVTVDDALLGINRGDMTQFSGNEPLAPNESLVFFYETTLVEDLENTAATSANPVDDQGADIADLADPTDEDTASVDVAAAGIDIQKSVYSGHDSGASLGSELVTAVNGSPVTYLFTVTNNGETHLDNITVDDGDLGITRSEMTQLSGSEPLAPGASLVFYYETTIDGDLINTATASGNPVDGQGTDLNGFDDPMDSDDATVNIATGQVNLLKLTDGTIDPNTNWNFSLYPGPNADEPSAFLSSAIANASTSGDADGVLPFGEMELDVTLAYTVCELGVPVGWSVEWMVDTSGDGTADFPIIPFNPNSTDDPNPEDVGNRCFDFGAGTDNPLIAGGILTFQVNNVPPFIFNGSARTPGYWKNWNTCSKGNQVNTAAKNGGPHAGFYLMDDLLPLTLSGVTVDSCETGVSILDQRDMSKGRKRASDAAYTLAMHLLAAKLNFAAGADTCQEVLDAAAEAEALLDSIGYDGSGSYLRPKNPLYQTALDLKDILDAYNNNTLPCN